MKLNLDIKKILMGPLVFSEGVKLKMGHNCMVAVFFRKSSTLLNMCALLFICKHQFLIGIFDSKSRNRNSQKAILKHLCCLLGEEPESQLHSHGSVVSGWLSAGQGGRTEFHAQTQGIWTDCYSYHP